MGFELMEMGRALMSHYLAYSFYFMTKEWHDTVFVFLPNPQTSF
jgi:hypothetical protein